MLGGGTHGAPGKILRRCAPQNDIQGERGATLLVTFADLKAEADKRWAAKTGQQRPRIVLGESAPDYDMGGRKTKAAFQDEIARRQLDVSLERTGNFGMDWKCPLVTVIRPGAPAVWYGPVRSGDVAGFIDEAVLGQKVNNDLALFAEADSPFEGVAPLKDLQWWKPQHRIVMELWGKIDPEDIYDYVAHGGYGALQKVLAGELTREQVIEELKTSGLAGRGGAYFPAGIKWEGAMKAHGAPKFVLCNTEEGEPSIYKDRRICETNPHGLIEGMAICGYVIGSHKGYNYIGPHPLAVERFNHALKQANETGVLGKQVLGFDYDLDIETRRGFGSYVSGEASAMQASIEGGRALPRVKLQRSVEAGVWEKPTDVNNTETFSAVPPILHNGGKWYSEIGQGMTGTKMYSITGHNEYVGLVEVPFGTPVRTFVDDLAGPIRSGRPIKSITFGGPTGGPIPPSLFDTPASPKDCNAIGVLAYGAGGVIVLDDSACHVDVLKYFMAFMENQSCGKCTPCRIGCHELLITLERISQGLGKPEDILTLEDMGDEVAKLSICGHGQAAPYPIFMVLQHYRDEVEAHINEKRCPAGVCAMHPPEDVGQTGYLLMQPVRVH